ncbi:hypothetical protein D3C76_1264270 [compost metagenome]
MAFVFFREATLQGRNDLRFSCAWRADNQCNIWRIQCNGKCSTLPVCRCPAFECFLGILSKVLQFPVAFNRSGNALKQIAQLGQTLTAVDSAFSLLAPLAGSSITGQGIVDITCSRRLADFPSTVRSKHQRPSLKGQPSSHSVFLSFDINKLAGPVRLAL